MSPDLRNGNTRARRRELALYELHQKLRLILTAAKIVQLHRNGGIYIREVFKWRLIERKNGWKEVSLMEIVQCEHMDQQAAKAPPCQSSG